MDFSSTINSLYVPGLGLNWLDIVIIAIIVFYAIEGYSLGFLLAVIDFASFVLSFILGVAFYGKIASFLMSMLKLTQGFANAIGFFMAAAISEIIFMFSLKTLVSGMPIFKELKNPKLKTVNQVFGIIPGMLSGILLMSFVLSLIIALPFSVFLKRSVNNSKIGSVLVENTQSFSKNLNGIFGGAVNDALTFFTIEPESSQTVDLRFKTKTVSLDKESEKQMFALINKERRSRGIYELVFSEELAEVGRRHCKDMFAKGYFSHYSPEGASPFDRMQHINLNFNYAGENLALAPNVNLAMKGLMQSIGHRDNILSGNFKKVGIGVIDGGIYGEMFCQEFSD